MMALRWHDYKYYPYERALAERELTGVLPQNTITHANGSVVLSQECPPDSIRRLVYFAEGITPSGRIATLQHDLEQAASNGSRRQSTRYSVHGLHEYKGKFNPQVVRALLNILQLGPGHRVLDPFCGSGTTLVECSHFGVQCQGTDVNPLAVFVANAKLSALAIPSKQLRDDLHRIVGKFQRKATRRLKAADVFHAYLLTWFDSSVLEEIESLRQAILANASGTAPIFLTIASNLLRDYSQQDPNDLRIRRRTSPIPAEPFVVAFADAAHHAIDRLEQAQRVIGVLDAVGNARLGSAATLSPEVGQRASFDAAITSPPYATALPYIDTQRLSLVWLRLVRPDCLLQLEAELIGSREIRGTERHTLRDALEKNTAHLPDAQLRFCRSLFSSLRPGDGFRRKAVPVLIYRYFSEMLKVFTAVRSVVRLEAPFTLIVGHNHTVLGGKRKDIDTPRHLVELAQTTGWKLQECLPLQTYQRYGYHMSNAVKAESLLILRAA